jgi:SPP1 gp7 family putative phage head morphogenesis protein
VNRAHAVAEIRILRALGPLPRRPRRGRLPRQLQPDAIRLSYFGALVRMVEAARDQVLAALKPRFAEFATAYAPTRHDAAEERADKGEHKGTFLGLKVPTAAAEAMALPDGEPASELHITLFYAKDLTAERIAVIEERFREVWAAYRPLEVVVRRLGVFPGSSSSDFRDVLYARPESQKLLELRAAFIARLAEDGIAPASEHEWRPHITLKYLEPGESFPPSMNPVRFELSGFVFEAGDPAVRADALDFNAFFDEIAEGFWQSWTNTRLAELARSMAGRTSAFQKEQLGRQFKAALGIDILKVEPWLGPKIEAFTAENVALVKSIPTRYFADVESQIVRGMREGLRWEELADVIEERTGVAESSAKLVARDQVGKFMAGVNEERQVELGVGHYFWRGAMDNRERDSHREMEGKRIAWDEPPLVDGEHVHPGEPILCRCEAEPDLDEVIAEITDEPRGDARLDWNEEDVVRVPAGQPGGGQFGAGRHTEQNPVPPLHPGAKAKLTKLKQKAAGEVQEHPSKLVAEPSSGLTPKETGEERSPVAKAPAHWGQEETSVKQPGHEYGSQIPMNPVTGKPYQGEKTEVAPAKAAPSAPKATPPAPTPKPAPPSKPVPAPAKPPPLPSQAMNPGHKAFHSKLVLAGKHEQAAAYLQKFGGEPAQPGPEPAPAMFTLEHLPVTRNNLESHLAGEIPQKADQELKSKTMVAFNTWEKSLTGKQRAVMDDYKGTGYKWMGKALRNNGVKENEIASLAAVTEALATAPETPRDFIVWRGIRHAELAKDPVGYLEGKKGIIHDNSFVSTSFSIETAKSFAGSDPETAVLYRITMPAGTRMRYWTSEHELLLQRDPRFQFEKVYKTSNGFTVIDGRYLGSTPVPLSQRGAKHDSATQDGAEQAGAEKFCWTEADFASGGVWIE